jgi:histidyl-tRNA synthetase
MTQPLIQAIRGMRDILPTEATYWRHLERHFLETVFSYGYQEIRLPIVEQTALFKRGIGEDTDIVEKEMYTFADRNGDSLTLRPEGTAVCVRAGIEHGLLYHQIQRLWYAGPMFRHERPQKGRYRQFHQFGVEAFGMEGADIEAEIILLSARLWARLGFLPAVTLQINSLGAPEARAAYRTRLVDYFTAHKAQLDEDSTRRLMTNPLRILDSKNPDMQALIAQAPVLTESLDAPSAKTFHRLRHLLDQANIAYEINPRLVRGLDYYNGMVFEWVTDKLGAQSAICSGGRYDALVELLGGKPTPAVGFALGVERVIALLQDVLALEESADVYLILVGEVAEEKGQMLAEQWRTTSSLRFITNCGGGSFKTQFKRADKSGARVAFILGENEMATQTISIKFLREEKEQVSVSWDLVGKFLESDLKKELVPRSPSSPG